jgi:hypothetical protein
VYTQLLERNPPTGLSQGRFYVPFVEAFATAAAILKSSFLYLHSLPVISERPTLKAEVQAVLECGESAGLLRVTQFSSAIRPITSGATACDSLYLARRQLSGAFKQFRNTFTHGGSQPVNILEEMKWQASIPGSIDALVRLHRKGPFGVGGPLLDFQPLPVAAHALSLLNTPSTIHWLKIALSEQGQGWLRFSTEDDPNTDALRSAQAFVMDSFWSTTLDQARGIAGQGAQPEFRELEIALRRMVTRKTPPIVRIAILGVVKSGCAFFVFSVFISP